MKSLNFEISRNRFKKYTVFIERELVFEFRTKLEAKTFIKKYKKVLLDNAKILNYFNAQLYQLYTVFYMSIDNTTSRKFKELHVEFVQQYDLCFHSPFRKSAPWVQFSKMRVCFDKMDDCFRLLKHYAGHSKKIDLLTHIQPMYKLFVLFEKDFESDLSSLRVNDQYLNDSHLRIVKQNAKDETDQHSAVAQQI